ncbi:MAG: extracellular solute-binding protein [Spirochaetaceae bacterium]|nr:MAG: extracellular solute-binding protein [Spirochaetaceae bacterium]
MLMKRQPNQLIGLALVLLLVTATLGFAGGRTETAAAAGDVIAIEYWDENNQHGIFDANHPQSVAFAEQFGIVWESPMVSWNGGTDYLQQLRLRIAAGDLPDIFMPWGGIEQELIDNGAVADLTDLIQEEMPAFYSNVAPEIWDFIRSLSPDGQSIYVLPSVQFTPLGGMIRGDWLDRLGLDVPTTVDEYVEVLRAFRDQDASGDGNPNNEIPTSGREGGRWMDHLFAPFGIAMVEGFPEWDIYDGELQYSAVQPAMRSAIEWIRGLYAEGLLDPETFINTNQVWMGKITGDLVGSWYHGTHWSPARFTTLYNAGVTDVRLDYLPMLSHPDYEGFMTTTDYRRPGYVFGAHMTEEAIRRTMRAIEFVNDPATIEERNIGYEGVNFLIENGQEVRLSTADFLALGTGYRPALGAQLLSDAETTIRTNEFQMSLLSGPDDPSYRAVDNANRLIAAYSQDTVRSIAGQFLPPSIYEGYPDIRTHRLFQEYVARIIVGDWEIDRFDEFVERWYRSGGREVTERAQAAYAALQ